jgi:lipopolysaccharide/colanic/teichoic acid biosynthesis glycosyltransferase
MHDWRWRRILEAKPGITDWATLAYRDEEELLRTVASPVSHYREVVLPDKLARNLENLDGRTPIRDCKLLWLTVASSLAPYMVRRRGWIGERDAKTQDGFHSV